MSKLNKIPESTLTKTLIDALHASKEIEANAHAETERLTKALQLARGTGDVTEQARAATNGQSKPLPVPTAKPEPRTTAEHIEHTLRTHGILSESALARTLGLSGRKLADEMSKLARAHKVYNIGSANHPRWCWVVGDKSTPAELNAQVYRLTSASPLTFQQLEAATGARRGRVSGAIVAMQRNPKIAKRIENLGNGRVFVWFVRPDKSER